MNTISKFENEFYFLSNFYPRQIEYKKLIWPTSEHIYQACKAKTEEDFMRIREAVTPGQARKLGRKIAIRPDWFNIRLEVMVGVVTLKFDQHIDLKQKLLNTEEAILIEGNFWHDNFWGDCYCRKCINIKGLNYLGRILMGLKKSYVVSS